MAKLKKKILWLSDIHYIENPKKMKEYIKNLNSILKSKKKIQITGDLYI